MKYHKSQSGSMHVVVIILLVLALFGALGFVFYQNFIAKQPSDSTQTTNDQTQNTQETVTSRLAFNNNIYALDHLKSWTAEIAKPTGTANSGAITVTSPNKTIEVKIVVSEGGLGGMCDPNDGLKLRYYNVMQAVITKLTKEPLYIVEAMTDYPGGGYEYIIGLAPEGGETHASLGDSRCTVRYVGVASRIITDPAKNTITRPTIIATIQFSKLPDADQRKVKSMDAVMTLLKTDDYKAAVKILESARQE